MNDIITFADITFGNLDEPAARFLQTNTPDDARCHVRRGVAVDLFTVLVEDLSLNGARDLLAGLAQHRLAAGADFPDVPNWRDIRTGTKQAWQSFAETHNIVYPAEATRERIAVGVRSWLEKNR